MPMPVAIMTPYVIVKIYTLGTNADNIHANATRRAPIEIIILGLYLFKYLPVKNMKSE
jgi:hypothetical protein